MLWKTLVGGRSGHMAPSIWQALSKTLSAKRRVTNTEVVACRTEVVAFHTEVVAFHTEVIAFPGNQGKLLIDM